MNMTNFRDIYKSACEAVMKIRIIAICVVAVLLSLALKTVAQDRLAVVDLQCEYKNNPLGIDAISPRLSWQMDTDARATIQSAYRIQAAADLDDLQEGRALLWDTDRLNSDQSVHIPYNGPSPGTGDRIYWRVRVWDNHGRESAWSEPAWWEMGLLKPKDWHGSWIEPDLDEDINRSQPCPLMRREFEINGSVHSARAYVSSLGLYKLHLNGSVVGDQVLTPGWTSYDTRLQYQVYDIKNILNDGRNAVGAILGDGWYRGYLGWGGNRNVYGNRLALLLEIRIIYEDGRMQTVVTDSNWRSSTGPILESDIYNGEIYDARLEKDGWDRAGYNDDGWKRAKLSDHDKEILVASEGPPTRRIQQIRPVKIFQTPAGDTVVDMGQNMVGWVQLRVKGDAGTRITLRHAEVLDKEGNFYTENLRSAAQRTVYFLKGGGREEVFEPHFTFHGFRYVMVKGYSGKLDLDSLTGIVVHSDMAPAGRFECSNELINQLQRNIQWGQRGNFVDVPTDCPQRDERMGWTGDAQVFCPTACYNFNAFSFFSKWLKDLAADQQSSGAVPYVVPNVISLGADEGGSGAAGWADAAVVIPWNLYVIYGDTRILETQYQSMKAWVEYMRREAGSNYLWATGFHFGDWLAYATTQSDYPGATTDKDLVASCYFAHSTDLLQRTARILGKNEDARDYAGLLEKIKQAIVNEFVTPNGRLSSNTQTAYSLFLAFDLVPDELHANAARRLAEDVRKFGHLTTGFLGTPLIMHALSQYGYLEEAYSLLNRKDYPSWLYPITKGATTIWERWDGIRPNGSFQDASMNSLNHYAYGAVGDWLYRNVAGINPDPVQPGFKHILIRPRPGGDILWAKGSLMTHYGLVESSWNLRENCFEVLIPPNTHGTVRLPGARLVAVTESGKPIQDAEGVRKAEEVEESLIVELGSGRYSFNIGR